MPLWRARALLLLFCPLALGQAPAFRWEIAGQTGGPTQALSVSGSYAYIGVGLNLRVIDITDPVSPQQVGASAPFSHPVEAIGVHGATAIVAAGPAGLATLDVSDPRQPRVLAALDTRGFASGVAIAGNLAYVADGPRGLLIVDISVPAAPFVMGSTDSLHYVTDVVVSGPRAYLAAGTAGLLVADVSDPSHPRITAALDSPGFAYSLDVEEGTVYLADGWEGLRLIDVSGEQPVETGRFQTAGWAFGVTVAASRAYVADSFRGVAIADLTDPTAPRPVARWEQTGVQSARVALAGNRVLVADRNLGLLLLDRTTPQPALLGAHRPIAAAVGLAVQGDYAYVASGNAGLAIVDVSRPEGPVEVSSIDTRGYFAENVAVTGGFAFVTVRNTNRGDEIQVFDVSDPRRPRRISAYSALDHVREPGQAYRDIAISRNLAHVPTEFGLELIDISNPAQPTTAGYLGLDVSTADASLTFAIAVYDRTAFVVSGFKGVLIVDVTDPANPVVLPSFNAGQYTDDAAVAGTRLYVTDHSGLRIADAAVPGQVKQLGFLPTPVPSLSVSVAEPVAFLANGANVLVVDVTSPGQPVLRQTIPISGLAQEVFVHQGLLYVAAAGGGLMIFRPSASPAPDSFPGAADGVPAEWSRSRIAAPRSPSVPPTAPGLLPSARREAAGDCVVTSTADSGSGSLRACLQGAVNGSTVTFDPSVFPPAQPATIHMATGLDAIRRVSGITIDASDAGVILDGSAVSQAPGLWLQSSGNTVRGLQILGFPTGISVGGSDNIVGGDRNIGRGPTGQGNVVSGSRGIFAIVINGETANGNRIEGNLVGTDSAGRIAAPNRSIGIFVGGANGNVVTGNLVSGNGGNGINLGGSARGNVIAGNLVGTDITGTEPLPNGVSGIVIETNAFGNLVEGNVSSGNVIGIAVSDPGTSFNSILNNRIGADITGTKAIPNTLCAAINGLGASFNRFEGNLVSGNHQGLCLGGGQGSNGVLVIDNRIGADITGTRPLPNRREGAILGGTSRMMVERNVISGNGAAGLRLTGDATYVAHNWIGTDANGFPLGNGGEGIVVNGTRDNFLQANRIANNAEPGVAIHAPGLRNTLRRNAIHDNRLGIDLAAGANGGIAPPALTGAGAASVAGTACAGCEVEIYSGAAGQGRLFEGAAISVNGSFSLTKAAGFAGPSLVAVATDAFGNTSEFSASVPAGPARGMLAAVSAASFRSGPVAAGSIVSVYGARLGTRTEAAASVPLPETLAGSRADLRQGDGAVIASPLIFVSPGQANIVIPEGAAPGPAALSVVSGDGFVSTTPLDIVSVSPGLFSASSNGEGLAAAVALRIAADGSSSFEVVARYDAQGRPIAVPIDLGEQSDRVFLLLYGTGIRNRRALPDTQVLLGGIASTVTFAGPVAAYPGLDQVNVLIPRSLRGRGSVPVELIVDGKPANSVLIVIR